ncbi:23S rRNA m(2)A-2503 methyltransferase [Anaerosphaera aminiphila DSM 21120]|uniref:Probable dual-specificity RNA methyltransferase RlmN n=1 Tax=Anaerosphaera aminiphila DSM 21120 TaxID=1120995 RepID=A0A1M5T0E7_9FIRM|nr:23S rRNA (adenine(2503)-C(2))-methyltransferase RlmN [Anaerosphaera aminiphila]SHH44206.1 23S rRNA m(2)A-2503 methyltransferase [Anaerosphaera aminiphila DSM 21120]
MGLNGLYLNEIEEVVNKYGEQKYRAKQIFDFLHLQKRTDIENSNLPQKLKIELKENEKIEDVKILEEFSSKKDDTKKLLFELEDSNIVEGVLMNYKHGYSQCISTQVGCRMGCVFCASTKEGLIRNLTAAEMLMQVYEVEKKYGITVSNVILMGSGEPLDNYDEVIKFLKLLHDEKGKNMSYRNMTISTCGIADKIYSLVDENLPITLAISLHTTNNMSRDSLMPINKKYNIEKVVEACKYYSENSKNRITFEYTLISGKNDSDKNARELKEVLRGLNSHINLIPLNPIEEYSEEKPSHREVEIFKKKLEGLLLNVTIRRELGSDINAACGQLRRDYKRGGNSGVCSRNQ